MNAGVDWPECLQPLEYGVGRTEPSVNKITWNIKYVYEHINCQADLW